MDNVMLLQYVQSYELSYYRADMNEELTEQAKPLWWIVGSFSLLLSFHCFMLRKLMYVLLSIALPCGFVLSSKFNPRLLNLSPMIIVVITGYSETAQNDRYWETNDEQLNEYFIIILYHLLFDQV